MRINRSDVAKKQRKVAAIIATIVVICIIVAIYFGCADEEEEVQITSIRTINVEQSHLNLLFSEYGEVSFDYVGRQASVYVAHFEYYELVLHELVSRLEFTRAQEFRGNMIWGITRNGNSLDQLRVIMNLEDADGGSASHQGYFNFSPLDFEVGAIINPTIFREPVERGEKYVFHVRQTGTIWWLDDDWFDPEVLAENAETVVLYIVFD